MIRTVVTAVSGAAVLAGALTGCSGTSKVPKDEVEKQTTAELTKTVGRAPDDVTCPGDLTAEVGTTMTCVLKADGASYDVAIKVRSVDDGKARFSIKVADQPN